MDMLQKQKWMMLLVIAVLTLTAVFFMRERISTIEYEKNFTGVLPSDIHKQTLDENTIEYKMLKSSTEYISIYNKNVVLPKSQVNFTLFFSIYNKYGIARDFWLSNLECNDGNTLFLNPKFEAFEKMTILQNKTKIFPIRVYYPKIVLDSPRTFTCRIHLTSGISEYAVGNFVLVLEPDR
ncbi:hypothetical protein JXM83_04490 [Candidatus Woesearchaeota archaeon]|nr:hypothetical protein [Candidatus Woesearchaeota archaeon]